MDPNEPIQPVNEADLDAGAYHDDLLLGATEEAPAPPEDWKARAIAAQTRLEVLQEMQERQAAQAPATPQQVDEVTQLRREIEAKRQQLPDLSAGNANADTFWQRDKLQQEINTLQEKMVDARLRQQERLLANQQVGTLVQQYKARFATRPSFKAIEAQFDTMTSQLEPHLRGNATMLDMIRSKLELDHMERTRGQRRAPPAAPDGAFVPQAQAQATNRSQAKWKTEQDRAVGEYYVQRGIISGPEEFYAARFNDNSESANNNGVAIYDVPTTPRGWRR
jgi:hypothetical protein